MSSTSSQTSHHTSSAKHDDLHLLTQISSSPRNSNPSTPLPQSTDPSGPLTPDTIHLVNPFAALATTNLPLLPSVRTIGEYELSETKFDDFKCARHIPTGEALLYKEFSLEIVRQRLEPYQRLITILQLSNKNSQLTIEQLAYKYHIHFFRDIISLDRTAIVLYPNYNNNLHQYITEKHRLNENESRNLFSQIVRAIQICHRVGLIVRDLKLRKIIFNDNTHTHLLLTGIDEAIMLSTPTTTDDFVSSRFSCPVYACPEIVLNRQMYSGKMADSWSLGTFSLSMIVKAYTPYI
jgi:serine/threonine protein kinase